MSSKRSRALSRSEDHNTSPHRIQGEYVVNESQRKSMKTEKSAEKSAENFVRPPIDENVSVSLHSKGARRSLPRRKDQGLDLAADLQRENAHVRSLLGWGLVGIAILFRLKVEHLQVHVDVHVVIVTLPQNRQGL